MSDLESLYFEVNDIEKETIEAMKKIAYMGYHRLALIRSLNKETWGSAQEDTLNMLYDMSRGFLSWRESDLEQIYHATRYLVMYGSNRGKQRGLDILQVAMEKKLKETR